MNVINVNDSKELILLGDFNINFRNKNSESMRQLHDFELFTNLKQQIETSTRNDNIIDLIYTNSSNISKSGVVNIAISDHELVYCTIKKARTRFNRIEYIGRSYSDYDPVLLSNYLNDYDWSIFMNILDPNECWDYLLNVITEKLNDMCPLKRKFVKDRNEPWLTNKIVDLIHAKNLAWKKAKKTKDHIDIIHAKSLRNIVKDSIRRAKATFVQDYLYDDRVTIKKFWEKVNYIMPTKDKQATINLIDQETLEPVLDTALPDYINNFFVGIGPKLACNFDDDWIDEVEVDPIDTMTALYINEDMLMKLIADINVHKSSAIDNVSSRVLKDAFMVLVPQLLYMYNQCLRLNVFPDSWKIANIVPLQKPGNPADVNNLRPISLLPLPGKLLEKIVHSQMSTFLENNDLLISEQGGFRKGKSTIHTIAQFTDDILLQLNDNNFTIAAFIDFKKAFDTVDHSILLRKLQHYGLGNDTLIWIKSYLSQRKQRCTINGRTSSELFIECGVPQGSIMGPMLFLLYINDLHNAFECTNYYLYADDTVVYMSDADKSIAHAGLQHDLYGLSRWCNLNRVTINVKKSKSMLFGTNNMLKKQNCTTYLLEMTIYITLRISII